MKKYLALPLVSRNRCLAGCPWCMSTELARNLLRVDAAKISSTSKGTKPSRNRDWRRMHSAGEHLPAVISRVAGIASGARARPGRSPSGLGWLRTRHQCMVGGKESQPAKSTRETPHTVRKLPASQQSRNEPNNASKMARPVKGAGRGCTDERS